MILRRPTLPASGAQKNEGSSRSRHFRLGISLLVVSAAGLFLASRLGSSGGLELRRRLLDVDLAWLVLAATLNFARYVVWALRWRWVLRPLCRVKRRAAFKALMISVLVNTLLPAARPLGGLIRARALTSSSGREPGPIYGGTLLDQMGYSVVSAIAGAFCIPWSLLPAAGRTRALPWSGWALLAALVSFLIWGLSEPARRHRLREWVRRRLPRTAETVAGAMEASRTLARRTGTYVLMVVGGSLVWFASAVVLMITARAVGAPIALHTAAAAWAVGSLAGAVSGTPGGMGATESAALLPLMGAGMTLPAALAAILLARGLHYVSALLIGSVCWIASGSMARRAGGGDGPGAMELTAPETALPASSAAPGGLPPQDRLSQ